MPRHSSTDSISQLIVLRHTYENLKWETTTSWNFGLDFGFLNGHIGGAIDFYTRKTKDLLASVPTAAGTNFSKTILTNVGNVDSKGIEVSLNATPIQTKDWEWNLSYNFTWQNMKVKNLSLTQGGSQTNVKVGPSIDAYQFQVLSEGYEPYMFSCISSALSIQRRGKPIEGAYADLNNDGEINDADLYRYHSPAPKYIMGLSTSLRYKQLTLGMSFRANIDNYVYNGMGMSTGALGYRELQQLTAQQPQHQLPEDRFQDPSVSLRLLRRECFLPEARQLELELQCRQDQQVGFSAPYPWMVAECIHHYRLLRHRS